MLLKPYEREARTDGYYLRLSNGVKDAILDGIDSHIFKAYLNDAELNLLSCFLTSYFEDIVSGTNVWNSFVRMHSRLYDKPLPFYDIDDYFEEEINPQDISFLIWYFLNTIQTDKFISPYNDFIIEAGDRIYEIFDEAWDEAPENDIIRSFYQIDENENDFYIARKLIDTILFKTYLFYTDTALALKEKETEIVNKNKRDENLLNFLNENRDVSTHSYHTRLLASKGKDWASEITGKNHKLSSGYSNMSPKISAYFLYKGQDASDIFIEHIASGRKFKLTKKSFEHSDGLKEIDTIVFMGIVRWQDEWWFSGVQFQSKFNPDLVLNERNSLKSRRAVDFLDYQNTETAEILTNQLKAFKAMNNGSQIVFLKSSEIDKFIKRYSEHYNASLKLSEKDIREAEERSRKDGYFGEDKPPKDFSEVSDSALVFFNPKTGVEMALAVNSAFPLPNNPFFDASQSDEHIKHLLMDESLSAELVMFCIDNCKSKLPFFKEGIGKKYLDDIDFLLRFWKHKNYHPKPSVTFIGEK